MTDVFIDVRAVLVSAGVSFTAVFMLTAGFGFNIVGIGAGSSISITMMRLRTLNCAFSSRDTLLTPPRDSRGGIPVRVLHTRWRALCYSSIDGNARNLTARASRRRWRKRRRGLCHRVGSGRGTLEEIKRSGDGSLYLSAQ